MIKTSTRMQKRREAGIHKERTKGFTPVYREPHNVLKDRLAAEKHDKTPNGESDCHPLSRKADVLERGWMWISYIVSRATARNERLLEVK